MKVIQVYSQRAWHDDAYIILNKEALVELKKCIEQAEQNGNAECNVFCIDGEGYSLKIMIKTDEEIDTIKLPYLADYASDEFNYQKKYPWN